MRAFRNFIKTTLIGGVIVLLPITIVAVVFLWIWGKLTGLVGPLANEIAERGRFQQTLAEMMALAILLGVCFLVGLAVRTAVGRFLHQSLEKRVLRFAPGYSLIKETALQFLGRKKSPFSTVAVARLFNSDTLVTAFVTEEHESGLMTLFVPTGPNPTSGLVYHVPAKDVVILDVRVEEAMRTIIGCGAGSSHVLQCYQQARQLRKP